jgi:hypothetical protein
MSSVTSTMNLGQKQPMTSSGDAIAVIDNTRGRSRQFPTRR